MDEASTTEERPAQTKLVVVSNRLPIDRVPGAPGTWRTSPGGLVTALDPVMKASGGTWVGWTGGIDDDPGEFVHEGITIVPVPLSADDIQKYYEGFSNDTLWPLYHDVISPPAYHREWWDSYVAVNRRFAATTAQRAEPGATVWIHDYQLQLLPQMLRELRPDLTIGYFHHIPFPAYGLYSQLPWRTAIIEGLLGADVLGFQRVADAGNFSRAVRRLLSFGTRGTMIEVPERIPAALSSVSDVLEPEVASPRSRRGLSRGGEPVRLVTAAAFPISIDSAGFAELAQSEAVQARADQIRAQLGNPKVVLFGVDRLDYTKGIGHRLKAFSELLEDGRIDPLDVVLVQVASPSRERVESYRTLRDEIELTVGRINGDYSSLGHTVVHYLHQGMPREEMVALYLAADVCLVTALRDGMNLVAKEYVASRVDNNGVLLLSEFAGAADEFSAAMLVNPHDIDGLKDSIVQAIEITPRDRRRTMKLLRRRVAENDVALWSSRFLNELRKAS